jgi:hypothetical protein
MNEIMSALDTILLRALRIELISTSSWFIADMSILSVQYL